MQYYLAPMEGITTYIYRNAHAKYFGGIDKYFTPFISDKNLVTNKDSISDKNFSGNKSINPRELRDILPENNTGIPLVPQVLTNNADRFLAVADKIASFGYDAVNLNLGCPSGTVTAKKRGAGFLSIPDELDSFLYKIYEKCPLKISIKTRLGVSDLCEWDRLLDIYAKYPIQELIIHTRLQQEFYSGGTHPEAYAKAVVRPIPLCYNGDIVSLDSLKDTIVSVREHTAAHINMSERSRQYTDINRVMIGRGIIRNPALAALLKMSYSGTCSDMEDTPSDIDGHAFHYKEITSIENWRAFHDEILDGYIKIMSGDSPVLFKMKDLWTYMSRSFTNSEKYLKKIRKANRISEYVSVVDMLFQESEVQQ